LEYFWFGCFEEKVAELNTLNVSGPNFGIPWVTPIKVKQDSKQDWTKEQHTETGYLDKILTIGFLPANMGMVSLWNTWKE